MYDGRYFLSYLYATKHAKRPAWKEKVPANSVVLSFSSLKLSNKLPMSI